MPYVDLPDLPGVFPADSLFDGPYAKSTALPLGSWRAMANGRVYTLEISAVGTVEGRPFEVRNRFTITLTKH